MPTYLQTLIRDYSDDTLAQILADWAEAQMRADLSPGQKDLRERWAVAAETEIVRRAQLRRLARVRELTSNHALLGIHRSQMLDAHDWATAEAMAVQGA